MEKTDKLIAMKHWQSLGVKTMELKSKNKNLPAIPKKNFPNKTTIKRYYLGKYYPNMYFTLREMDVAVLLIKNCTYQQIAEILSLSARTIEYYTKQIRLKLRCDKKSESVQLLRAIEIIKNYDMPC